MHKISHLFSTLVRISSRIFDRIRLTLDLFRVMLIFQKFLLQVVELRLQVAHRLFGLVSAKFSFFCLWVDLQVKQICFLLSDDCKMNNFVFSPQSNLPWRFRYLRWPLRLRRVRLSVKVKNRQNLNNVSIVRTILRKSVTHLCLFSLLQRRADFVGALQHFVSTCSGRRKKKLNYQLHIKVQFV